MLLATGLANAEPPPPIVAAEFPDLQRYLLSGDKRLQNGVFDKLAKQPRHTHTTLYAGVVAPLFTDAPLYSDAEKTKELSEEARRALFTVLIKHLVSDQPAEDGAILLVPQFVRQLNADPKLREELRTGESFSIDIGTKRSPDWDRMIDSIILEFRHANPEVRAAAMLVAADSAVPKEERVRVPRIVAHLYLAKQAAGAWQPGDDEVYLDALVPLVQHRFADSAAADALLAPFAERFNKVKDWRLQESDAVGRELFDAVLGLKANEQRRGGEKHRDAAIKLGRALIDKATSPQDLMQFFAAGDRIVELQRLAVKKAGGMKPEGEPGPDDPPGAWPAWAALHVAALDNSADGEVLAGIAGLIRETFSKPNPKTDYQQVATAVARRLRDGAKADAIDARMVLADVLGSIGTIGDVRDALPATVHNGNAEKQAPVYGALIGAIGRVQNGFIEALLPYLLKSGDTLAPEWARVAVAKALGYSGFRPPAAEAPRAALVLQHILTGEAVEHTNADGQVLKVGAGDPDASPSVRGEAIGSLANYPGPAVARILEGLARLETAEAELALRALGRHLRRESPDAAEALANLIAGAPPEKRQLAILEHVAQGASDELPAAALSKVRSAVSGLLDGADVPQTVRLKAAAVAAKLRDADAIEKVIKLWKPELKAPAVVEAWRKPLEALLIAVAGTPKPAPALFEKIADALKKPAEDNHADVLALYAAMGEIANTNFTLKRARADVHYTYSTSLEQKDIAAAREQLDAAIKLWKALIPEANPVDRQRIYSDQLVALTRRATEQWLADGESAVPFLIDAIYAATQSKRPADLTFAQTNLVPKLGALDLEAEQKDRLVALKAELEKLQKPN